MSDGAYPDGEGLSEENSANSRYEEFVRLLLAHEREVKIVLRTILPDWGYVDEAIQEASLVAWRKFDDFQLGTNFRGWYVTIARFEAMRLRKKLQRNPIVFSETVCELLADTALEMDESDSVVKMRALEHCLSKLNEVQRKIVLMAHTPGVVIRSMAESAGKSEEAMYKQVQRLRVTLLECIKKSIKQENRA
jgi:RNA polymerase sigma-70 factor, ECF subfamily